MTASALKGSRERSEKRDCSDLYTWLIWEYRQDVPSMKATNFIPHLWDFWGKQINIKVKALLVSANSWEVEKQREGEWHINKGLLLAASALLSLVLTRILLEKSCYHIRNFKQSFVFLIFIYACSCIEVVLTRLTALSQLMTLSFRMELSVV